jgi:hypothetical protein
MAAGSCSWISSGSVAFGLQYGQSSFFASRAVYVSEALAMSAIAFSAFLPVAQ